MSEPKTSLSCLVSSHYLAKYSVELTNLCYYQARYSQRYFPLFSLSILFSRTACATRPRPYKLGALDLADAGCSDAIERSGALAGRLPCALPAPTPAPAPAPAPVMQDLAADQLTDDSDPHLAAPANMCHREFFFGRCSLLQFSFVFPVLTSKSCTSNQQKLCTTRYN